MAKINPFARRQARRYLVQALYGWQLTQQRQVSNLESPLLVDKAVRQVDKPYFNEILQAIVANVAPFDQHITSCLDRPLNDVDPIELAILRLGVYELAKRIEIPYRVVINEALELAKVFGNEESHKYINGVLDRLARKLRHTEVLAYTKPKQ